MRCQDPLTPSTVVLLTCVDNVDDIGTLNIEFALQLIRVHHGGLGLRPRGRDFVFLFGSPTCSGRGLGTGSDGGLGTSTTAHRAGEADDACDGIEESEDLRFFFTLFCQVLYMCSDHAPPLNDIVSLTACPRNASERREDSMCLL